MSKVLLCDPIDLSIPAPVSPHVTVKAASLVPVSPHGPVSPHSVTVRAAPVSPTRLCHSESSLLHSESRLTWHLRLRRWICCGSSFSQGHWHLLQQAAGGHLLPPSPPLSILLPQPQPQGGITPAPVDAFSGGEHTAQFIITALHCSVQ